MCLVNMSRLDNRVGSLLCADMCPSALQETWFATCVSVCACIHGQQLAYQQRQTASGSTVIAAACRATSRTLLAG